MAAAATNPGYAPPGKFLWDAWFLKVANYYHLFHLQADRTHEPDERHHNQVSIGHAVSSNLSDWTPLPPALEPGEPGEWDDLSLWTGCVFATGQQFYLFYTARTRTQFWIQRLGLATSVDLVHWTKFSQNPILEADNRHYDMKNEKNALGVVPAFRDPFIFEYFNPATKKKVFYLVFCGRAKDQPPEYNGCLGVAVSKNLIDWRLLPPLLAPARYDEMEVPQLLFHRNQYYLFFTTYAKNYSPIWQKQVSPATGLHCYVSDQLLGPYEPWHGHGVVSDNPQLMGLRLIEPVSETEYLACGWLNTDADGNFIGRLASPINIAL